MPILGIIELPMSNVTFLVDFGSRQGLPGGVNRRGGTASPPVCFSTFWLITVISPCVFDVFRITEFRYRWRERFPLEIYLSQRESRRSIPERQPVFENHTPLVPEARWRIFFAKRKICLQLQRDHFIAAEEILELQEVEILTRPGPDLGQETNPELPSHE